MDEVLRRRLVGAAVLLTGAFIVASVLPDPARPAGAAGGRVVTYDLRTGAELGPAARTVERRRPDVTVAPDNGAPATAAVAPRPQLKVEERLAAPAHGWYLQIASFESQANARNALQKLYGAGLPATIQSMTVGNKLWYRVRVGPYADEAAAQKALATVRQQGFPLARLVRPDAPSADARN
jgi:cell division septation protein DedD